MKKIIIFLILITIITILEKPIEGRVQEQVLSPKVGSQERTLILDTLRKPVEKELKQKVKFKVDSLKTQRDWAFMRGQPQGVDGKAIDYKVTPYREALEEGLFDDGICALLHKEAGKWKVVVYVIGATDVAWDGWDKEYKAPQAIFK